jgi:hypothetical protein
MNVQWLLIGGPSHGTAVWIKAGSRVMSGGVIYEGRNYLHDGDLYRVGYVDEKDLDSGIVGRLIVEKRLEPVGGRAR